MIPTKAAMYLSASFAVLAATSPAAFAQVADETQTDTYAADEIAAAQNSDGSSMEAIIVSGSRVKRDGYSAPTPETVVGAAELQAKAPANLADVVNQLPALAGSSTPRQATVTVSSGSGGSNFLNLRGLGASRTLVLLDGRRVVGANVNGLVDVNTLPSALVSRIDVVTGGASAAYGSDAVTGVVNFVLDTRFTGLKLEGQTGITTYGDDFNYKVEGAYGTGFAGGRGHFIASATYSKVEGIREVGSRPWYDGQKIIPNPAYTSTNGEPQLINASDVNHSRAAFGGLITSGTLRGTQFGLNGAQSDFTFGTLSGPYMIGGTTSDLASFYALDIPLEQFTTFGRLSFEVNDAFQPFVEVNYGKAIADAPSAYNFHFGNITIQADNAFLPDDLRAQLQPGETSFSFGTLNPDLGRQYGRAKRELQRYVIGAQGDLGGSWSYEVYGQYGQTHVNTQVRNLEIKANYARAVDAVYDVNDNIVCRSTLTDPTNGCVPYNVFGYGLNGQDAIDYVTGASILDQKLEQYVGSASIQGEPAQTWAGPISFATGLEYRKEQVNGTADPISLVNGYFSANYKPSTGKYDVYEGFAEVVVPLLADSKLGESLDFNGAVRRTHYSTSGNVNTWKLGLTYQPISDIRFRAVRSRDIRAPNLNDLFQGGVVASAQTVNDPVIDAQQSGFTAITSGSPSLKPEIARSFSVGAVLTPSFLPGFSLSVDYYDIKISGAINTLTVQQIVDGCYAGNAVLCADVQRTGTTITNVYRRPVNINTEGLKGVDIDGAYVIPADIMGGTVTLRGRATYTDTRYIDDGSTRDEAAGENSGAVPKWRANGSVGFNNDDLGVIFTGRYVSPGKYDNAYTPAVLEDNSIPGAMYFDLSTTFKFEQGSMNGSFFVNVDNVFNKDPVIVSAISQPFLYAPINAQLYDTIGRSFRVGFRLKM